MPLGVKPICIKCDTTDAEIWHKNNDGNTVCNGCLLGRAVSFIKTEILTPETNPGMAEMKSSPTEIIGESIEMDDTIPDESPEDTKPRNEPGPGTRSGNASSTRGGKGGTKKSSRGRNKKTGSLNKTSFSKGRGRRSVYKKQPTKAPGLISTTVTTGHLFHQDIYYQVGDIVSAIDEDGGIYYAQIRGLLQDQFCEKSAVLTWLIPTQSSPPPERGFDPLTYIIGPEEELPRKLDYLDFVMHAPNEYYKLDENIRVSNEKEAGYIWTSMGAVRRTITS